MYRRTVISLLSIFWLAIAAQADNAPVTMQVGVSETHQQAVQQQGPYALGWQILQLAVENTGINLAPVPAPWSWSVTQLQREQISAVFFAGRTETREAWAQFSPPLSVTIADFFSDNAVPIRQFSDARREQLVVGVLENSIHKALLEAKGFTNLYPVLESDKLINMLMAGRLTHIYVPTNLVQDYCQRRSRTPCFTPSGINLTNVIHLMGRRQDRAFTAFSERLYRQLLELDQQQKIKPLFFQFGMTEQSYQHWLKKLQQQREDLNPVTEPVSDKQPDNSQK